MMRGLTAVAAQIATLDIEQLPGLDSRQSRELTRA